MRWNPSKGKDIQWFPIADYMNVLGLIIALFWRFRLAKHRHGASKIRCMHLDSALFYSLVIPLHWPLIISYSPWATARINSSYAGATSGRNYCNHGTRLFGPYLAAGAR
jgi:hypothetical protein